MRRLAHVVHAARQHDADARAHAVHALRAYGATRLRHHAVDDSQSKAGALAKWPGGEERFEDALPDGVVHAHAGVADRERRLHRVVVDTYRQRQRAATGHGIARVLREVEHYLLQLPAVGPHARPGRGPLDAHGHRCRQRGAEQRQHVAHERCEVHALGQGRLPAAE